MSLVRDKVWFLREGLFAKYVVALVGLVVFVLAVNGAMETGWESSMSSSSLLTPNSPQAPRAIRRVAILFAGGPAPAANAVPRQ